MAVRIAVAQGALANLDEVVAGLPADVELVTGSVDTPARVAELTEGAQALVVSLHRLDEAAFSALPDSVRVIGRAGVGLDTIDLDAARRRNVAVVYQPAYATGEVATHAVAMLLSLQRRLGPADAAVRAGWGSATDVGRVWSMDTASVAVVGCGRIGRAVVDRLRPFFGEVRVFDPFVTDDVPGARVVSSLAALVDGADALTLHVPLQAQTRHLIGSPEIGAMNSGSLLVNVSRGGLVDEAALAKALHDGHLAGAGLDVFETEPLPEPSALRSAPNLLLSPHVAWYSETAATRLRDWTIADVLSYTTRGQITHGRFAAGTGS
ncbi:C-terminal binding protein [Asanoa sp. NPDC049573]|uniref:C-terminal binding protein n=1 Tax=Asanoa sp. NPDC049573 TaxID=3155396 RepID=UPI00344AA121